MSEILTTKVLSVLINEDDSGISVAKRKIHAFSGRGIKGDKHWGATRLADVRERDLLSVGICKGTEIINIRQFSAVSEPELAKIAEVMGLSSIAYGLLGENLVLDTPITQLPIGTAIYFSSPSGEIRTSSLMVMEANLPCDTPARNISEANRDLSIVKPFQLAAKDKRGVVGVVYSSGFISVGDTAHIHIK